VIFHSRANGFRHAAPTVSQAGAMSVRSMLSHRLQGPPIALPAALDRCSEQWRRLPPRCRMAVGMLAFALLLVSCELRVAQARERWGGPPRRALIAVRDIAVGEAPQVRAVRLPPALVPPDAPQEVGDDARLAFALPEDAVLTRGHLSARGPAAGLRSDLRVVPIPADPGWDIRAGGWVDVWALATSGQSRRIGRQRPVVAVTVDDDQPSALVGLAPEEVAAAVRGLADGEILLTHAPP
jgi:hypothetical protein